MKIIVISARAENGVYNTAQKKNKIATFSKKFRNNVVSDIKYNS